MLELAGVLAVLIVVGVVIGALGMVAWLVKLLFKIALIPLGLGLAVVKGLALLVGSLLALAVVAPLVIGLGIALLAPLVVLGAIVWAGVAIVS